MNLRLTSRVAALLALATAPVAAAPTKDACLEANSKAQDAQKANKLRQARESLLVCVDPACPAILRDDCTQRMDALNSLMPSVIFEAKDAEGRDLANVTVTMDGEKLSDVLDGSPIVVDPGAHQFVFTTVGQPPATKSIVVRQGERNRREPVLLGASPAARPSLAVNAHADDAIRVDGKAVGVERWSGMLTAGPHELVVAHEGKKTFRSTIQLIGGAQTVDVTLEEEPKRGLPLWAWIAGGVVLASGAAVGGYFLFKSDDKAGSRPIGSLDSTTLSFPVFGR